MYIQPNGNLNETKLVYGKLEWFGKKSVYPGIGSRLIKLQYVY